MSIPRAADTEQLHAELRSLAGGARAAVDALVASWYLEFRSRTGIPYATWHDDAVKEVAAAVLFGAGTRPGCGRLGATRAAAGFGEAELRDDVAALVAAAASEPTLPAAPDKDDLTAAALAGWQAASRLHTAAPSGGEDPPGAAQLRLALGHLVAERSIPEPVVIVVDVAGHEDRWSRAVEVRSVLERLTTGERAAADTSWFELVPGSRYAAVTRRTRDAALHVAALRGALRVAPDLVGLSAHVWMEAVPGTSSDLPSFVRGLTGTTRRRHRRAHSRDDRRRRVRGHRHRRGWSTMRHGRRRSRPERWLAPAAAALLLVSALGTLAGESAPDGSGSSAGANLAAPPRGPDVDMVLRPPSGGTTGVTVDDLEAASSPEFTVDGPLDVPPSPGPPQVILDPTPIANVEPVDPVPPEPAAEPPPQPAAPPSPDPAPPPAEPNAEPIGDMAPGPPAHALVKIPSHAPPRGVGHPPGRAGMTRM